MARFAAAWGDGYRSLDVDLFFDTLRVGSHRYWLVGGVQLTDAPERNQSARADFVAAADYVRSGEHVRHFRGTCPRGDHADA